MPSTPTEPIITTRVAPGFLIRTWLIAVVLIVLGVWGLYDYTISIPRRMELGQRRDILTQAREVFDGSGDREAARVVVAEAIAAIGEPLGQPPTGTVDLDDAIESLRDRENEQAWLVVLLVVRQALAEEPFATGEPTPTAAFARTVAIRGQESIGDVTPPAAFDWYFQWVYIVCLSYGLWMVATVPMKRRKRFTVDGDGVLGLPGGGRWKPADIASIDMDRWMSKSVAEVVHVDGSRVRLDAYVHHHMNEIVGSIASRFEPDRWDDRGRDLILAKEREAMEAADGGLGPGRRFGRIPGCRGRF